jgi:hypothetical protein
MEKELIELINTSESMETQEEKTYWINLLPTMTDEHKERLYKILDNERQKLLALEKRLQRIKRNLKFI